MATLKEVADAAGVHQSTASRALNPGSRHLVTRRTAERIESVAREMGYFANPIARSLKTARTETIGIVVPDLTNPLVPPILRGVEDVLRSAGYVPWLVNTDNDPRREEAAVESFRQRRVEGFVFATARLSHPLIMDLARTDTPLVLVNRRVDSALISSVTADDEAGVSLAMSHLHALGHRQVVHVAGPQDTSTGRNRRRAFQHAVEELELPFSANQVVTCDAWSIAEGAKAMTAVLSDRVPHTAVLAGNDLLALGALEALDAAGRRCPEDVSVVGFNDMPFMDKVTPALTTVSLPHYDLGSEAARLLLELLADPGRRPRSMLLPVQLVVRASTAALAV